MSEQGKLLITKDYVTTKIEELKNKVDKLNKKPKLVIVRVNDDEPSERYIRNKIKRCEEVGIISEIIKFNAEATHE